MSHIYDMVNRWRQNRALLSRKKFKENRRDTNIRDTFSKGAAYDFPEMDKASLESFRDRLQTQKRRHTIKVLLLTLLIAILIVAFLWFLRPYGSLIK